MWLTRRLAAKPDVLNPNWMVAECGAPEELWKIESDVSNSANRSFTCANRFVVTRPGASPTHPARALSAFGR
jgi:hypothetical protein